MGDGTCQYDCGRTATHEIIQRIPALGIEIRSEVCHQHAAGRRH